MKLTVASIEAEYLSTLQTLSSKGSIKQRQLDIDYLENIEGFHSTVYVLLDDRATFLCLLSLSAALHAQAAPAGPSSTALGSQ